MCIIMMPSCRKVDHMKGEHNFTKFILDLSTCLSLISGNELRKIVNSKLTSTLTSHDFNLKFSSMFVGLVT